MPFNGDIWSFTKNLMANPNMLEGQSKFAVVDPVCNNCQMNYWSRHRRHLSYDALDNDVTDHPDEWLVTGLEATGNERWAAWATATDARLDIHPSYDTVGRKIRTGGRTAWVTITHRAVLHDNTGHIEGRGNHRGDQLSLPAGSLCQPSSKACQRSIWRVLSTGYPLDCEV